MRATLSPAFTGRKMRLMFNFVAQVGKQTAETLKQKIINTGKNDFEFKELATKFTVDNIASCAFGIEVNSFEHPDNEFHNIAMKFSDFASFKTFLKFLGFIACPKLMKIFNIKFFSDNVKEFFREATVDTMRIREEKGIIRPDMIDLLMQAKKGNLIHEGNDDSGDGFATVEEYEIGRTQNKPKWEEMDLVAQCFIFFVAGFDTVSKFYSKLF